jgi:hypothetical protein
MMDVLEMMARAWLAAFQWDVWALPVLATLLGGAVGLVAMVWLGRRGSESGTFALERATLDLARRRDVVIDAVRALDLESDKLDPSDYERERRALLAHGAEAMRTLDQEIHVSGSTEDISLKAVLEAQREALGEEKYGEILRVLDGPSARGPRISPRWEGALWTLGVVGSLLGIYLVLHGVASDRTERPVEVASDPTWTPEESAAHDRLRTAPEDLDALNTLTDYGIRRQKWGEAAGYNQRALRAAPTDRMARTWSALLAFRAGSLDEAASLLDGVLHEEPTHPIALQYRGLLAMRMGQPEQALQHLQAAVEVSTDPEVRVALRQLVQQIRAETADASAPEIHGSISLAPGVDPAEWGERASIFVSVRAVDGPPMPLRAKKFPVGPFPMDFSLGRADSPMGGGALPERVAVVVKVDLNGNPMGDDPGAPKVTLADVVPSSDPITVVLGRD